MGAATLKRFRPQKAPQTYVVAIRDHAGREIDSILETSLPDSKQRAKDMLRRSALGVGGFKARKAEIVDPKGVVIWEAFVPVTQVRPIMQIGL